MDVAFYIISALWIISGCTLIIQYFDIANDLGLAKWMIVCFIFLAFGPCFLLVNILESILDLIMPEGWNDNDDIEKH